MEISEPLSDRQCQRLKQQLVELERDLVRYEGHLKEARLDVDNYTGLITAARIDADEVRRILRASETAAGKCSDCGYDLAARVNCSNPDHRA